MLEFSVKCLRTRNRWVPHNNASQGLFRKADPERRLLPNGSLKVAFSPIVKRHPWLRENSADDIYGKNTIGGDEPVSVGGGGDAVFKGDENLYLSVFPEEPGLDENDEASSISFVIPSVKLRSRSGCRTSPRRLAEKRYYAGQWKSYLTKTDWRRLRPSKCK